MTAREPKSDTVKTRFDFDSDANPDESQTGTIRELLDEINRENLTADGVSCDLKSLGTTLRFLRSISGMRVRSTTELHSLSTLKTIKLLHQISYDGDSHLMRLLEPPSGNNLATLDFLISPPTPQDKATKRQIDQIKLALEREIDQDELLAIKAIGETEVLREVHRKATNEAIDAIILKHIHVDDELLRVADWHLLRQTTQFSESILPIDGEPRLHVATYLYLKVLDYLHLLHFEVELRQSLTNDRAIGNMSVSFSSLCERVSAQRGETINRDTNHMSFDDVIAFCNDYASELAQLVARTTGFKYNKRDITQDYSRAMLCLAMYLSSNGLPNEENNRPIGAIHVVAAFSSVLHQRKTRTKLLRASRKYGPKLTSPQKQLDAALDGKTDHVPWTTRFIYVQRTLWYVHALEGRKDKSDSHSAFQDTQSKLMQVIYMSLNHVEIFRLLESYRAFMIEKAKNFIVEQGRQDTIYRWHVLGP